MSLFPLSQVDTKLKEYGSLRSGLKAMLTECRTLSEVHMDLKVSTAPQPAK